jgi:hypothetical protein
MSYIFDFEFSRSTRRIKLNNLEKQHVFDFEFFRSIRRIELNNLEKQHVLCWMRIFFFLSF